MDYLNSFRRYSKFNIYYTSASPDRIPSIPFAHFDGIIISYALATQLEIYNIETPLGKALAEYSGIKSIILQDEYDHLQTAPQGFARIGIDLVVTNMYPGYEREMYPTDLLPSVRFVHALTGYVPDNLVGVPVRPLRERKWVLGYRGRPLHYKYGRTGQEKLNIGTEMRKICEERGIPVNIAWTEEERIYGPDWPDFIQNCRATLGSESASEVFDFTGTLRADIDAYLEKHPAADYEEVHELFLKDIDGKIPMRTASPRIFEAICLHTGLVLFEGAYSQVVTPWEHYIPLKKDFSNVDEVFAHVQDDDFLTQMTTRAYADIVESGKYSYKAFIERLDQEIEALIGGAAVRSEFSCFAVEANSFNAVISPFPTVARQAGIKVKVGTSVQSFLYPPIQVGKIRLAFYALYTRIGNNPMGKTILSMLKRVPGLKNIWHAFYRID